MTKAERLRKERGTTPILRGVLNGRIQVKVFCPNCDLYHYHGWDRSADMSRIEHRAPHCYPPSVTFEHGGYYIGLLPEEIARIKKERRAIERAKK